jgi:acyl-CoA dehydrogenase
MALGQTSPAFRSIMGTNNGIGAAAVVFDGSEAQKQKFLPRYASGEWIGCFCLTEPDVGSDAAAVKTTARREGDHYILNGTKRYITNGPIADTFSVMARTDPEVKGARGISAFIVEKGTAGITLGAIDKKMGQAGSLTCDVIFEDCPVPAENLIGTEGGGFITAMKVLDRGRLHISGVSVGVAERLIGDALGYAINRKQFGKPIAEHQLIQAMLADSRTEAYAARCMVLETARARDRGENVSTESSAFKLFATEMVGRVADRAVQIHGGAGYVSDYAVERFYRDVRLFRLYEGTSQIQQLIIARNMIRDAS